MTLQPGLWALGKKYSRGVLSQEYKLSVQEVPHSQGIIHQVLPTYKRVEQSG